MPVETSVKSGWVEHTWSTFISRAEDDTEDEPKGRVLLSDFQQHKFRHFFYHVLDLNNDHVISEEDFTGLNSRVRHYMQWSVNTPQYLTLTEVHDHFMKYFLAKSIKFEKVGEIGEKLIISFQEPLKIETLSARSRRIVRL